MPMRDTTRKDHWDKIYETKQPEEVSWTQENPKTSLQFIHNFKLSKSASIIDIGGGNSRLVDKLLAERFEDITVLDISEKALMRVQARLGEMAKRVKWIVSDVTEFTTERTFDVWHDRATFHFLTTDDQIAKYLARARKNIKEDGFLVIGTFSDSGPKKCSGLEVKRYSEKLLEDQLGAGFRRINCLRENHETPFKTLQNFLFCSFKRVNSY